MEPCPGCGLQDGAEACQSLFNELGVRASGDYRYARRHRLAVDAYCLQHPPYCASAKSLMAHLGGLCCALEYGAAPAVYNALQRSLNGSPALEKPLLPSFRGELTIAHALRAPDPESFEREVERWARAVWAAYDGLQPLARQWLTKVTGSR